MLGSAFLHRGSVRLLALAGLLLCAAAAEAQTGRIAGTVRDTRGETLPGANVAVVGTTRGAVTDFDGAFEIADVPVGRYALRVTYIGYQEARVDSVAVTAGATTRVTVTMREGGDELEEIVVVGYGVQRRAEVTGAVASVSAADLDQQTSNNIGQALQGRIPGLTVSTNAGGAEGNNLSLDLRGRNSITASNRPLIIVDGIPYGGSISDINPQDIATIDVLRDASSAAIYGSRGANGVLLVTTKKGGDGRPRVSYEGKVGTSESVNIPRLMNGREFAIFKCQRLANTRQVSQPATPDCPDNPTEADVQPYLTATELEGFRTGRTTDWVSLATRTGIRHEHSLAFSGGSQGVSYYVGGSVLNAEGVATGDKFDRYTLRANVGQKAFGWLELGTNTQLSISDRSGIASDFGEAFYSNPLSTAYEEDGSLDLTPWQEDVFLNPLEGTLATDDDLSQRVFTSNFAEVQLPFLRGLSYRLNAGFELENRKQGRYYGRNTKRGLDVLGDGRTADSYDRNWTVENLLRFQRAFGKHNVDLTTLYSAESAVGEANILDFQSVPGDVLTYYQANVAALVLPSNPYTKANLVSQMARLNYGFGSRYVATLTVRRDGYSGFGANNKYAVFPSVALGWNVDREPFFGRNPFVERLKVRLSYGENGNQAIAPYQTLARLREFSYVEGESTRPGYLPATLGNPNLRWETTTSFNAGTDFVLFKGRLEGSVDTYANRTSDLLLARSISSVHGVTSVTENVGETSNKGVELQLTGRVLDRGLFRWSIDANLATNRNRITGLYSDTTDDVANEWFIGQPVLVNYGYRFGGIFQNADEIAASAQKTAKVGDVRVEDVNGDGAINADDRVLIGSRQPDFIGGLGTTVSYGGLSLNVFVNTVQGVSRANSLRSSNQVFADVRRNIPVMDYWSAANPINTYPENRDGANPFSVGFYEDASFVRLRDVTLSYTLPRSLLTRLGGVERARLQLNGHNLYTWTDWSGLDPELDGQRAIPLERTITFGLDFSF